MDANFKYIVKMRVEADGVIEDSDVIGALFGQLEGLLGQELELKELQKAGRIGRIKVQLTSREGRSTGHIIIPSSLSRVETAILAAAIETIEKIGPCSAKIKLEEIVDNRENKRKWIVKRAVEILKAWEEKTPETQELKEQVLKVLRTEHLITYGPEKLPAGSAVPHSDTVIIVEGRADVINLLKHGITNAIAIGGTHVPKTIIDLSKKKTTIAFVDGDRGGELILKELLQVADIDYIARAPKGKGVEELTRKEILNALKNKIPVKKEENKATLVTDLPMAIVKELVGRVAGKLVGVIARKDGSILLEAPVEEFVEKLSKEKFEGAYVIVIDGIITQRLVDLAYYNGVRVILGLKTGELSKIPLDVEIRTFKELGL